MSITSKRQFLRIIGGLLVGVSMSTLLSRQVASQGITWDISAAQNAVRLVYRRNSRETSCPPESTCLNRSLTTSVWILLGSGISKARSSFGFPIIPRLSIVPAPNAYSASFGEVLRLFHCRRIRAVA